jgi:hypothetical protein
MKSEPSLGDPRRFNSLMDGLGSRFVGLLLAEGCTYAARPRDRDEAPSKLDRSPHCQITFTHSGYLYRDRRKSACHNRGINPCIDRNPYPSYEKNLNL